MGSKMGSNYAWLFVGYVEEQIRGQYTGFFPSSTRGTLMTSSGWRTIAGYNLTTSLTLCPAFTRHFNSHTPLLRQNYHSLTSTGLHQHFNLLQGHWHSQLSSSPFITSLSLQGWAAIQSATSPPSPLLWRYRLLGKGSGNEIFFRNVWLPSSLTSTRSREGA